MIEGSCHCGTVTLRVAEELAEVTECNCSICRRYGVLWWYVAEDSVPVRGATDTYRWGGKTQDFHRCAKCGCVTHWQKLEPGFGRVGVNARLVAPEVLARAVVHRLDGAVTDEYLD